MSDRRVQSVERSIAILMALANGPKTLTEVTRETGLSKGTTFRLLASLNYENLVVKAAGMNHYMLGPGFLRLVQGAMQGIGGITAVAKPSLVSLWEKTEETVTVHVRVGSERVCIEEIPSPQPIRYISTLGAAAPLHVGAAGKVLLAFMDAGELDQLLKTLPLTPLSDKTTTNVEVLLAELETVRRRGYAISMGERIKGAAAVTVPVRGLQGFAASLSILGPVDRLPHKRLVELVPVLQETSAEIEQALTMSGARGRVVEAVS